MNSIVSKYDVMKRVRCNNVNSFFMQPTSEYEVIQYINKLKNHKAPGKDGIRAELIKDIKEYICKPLTYIFNLIFETGIYPTQFKEAVVTPIFKTGDKKHLENYRPISLISNFNKILEQIIKVRMNKFVTKHKLLSQKQYGFREGKSTIDAVSELVGLMYAAMDDSKPTICVFVDLAKAFDTVSHGLLLEKLERMGFRGVSYKLFKSYFSDRKQYVKMGNSLSGECTVKYGVPQGTVLGPLFFIIYVNEILTSNTSGTLFSYADDTAILYSGETWNDLKTNVELDLNRLIELFERNLLTINFSKTFYLPITSYNSNLPDFEELSATTANQSVKVRCTDKIKYLGVILDGNLRWKCHIEYTVQRLRGIIYKFKELKPVLTNDDLFILYTALVESLINYGILAWGGVGNLYVQPLENIQKSFLKIILGKNRRYSTEKVFEESGKFDIRQLYMFSMLNFYYKNKNLLYYVYNIYDTRSVTKKQVQIKRTIKTIGQKCFTYKGPKLYNLLPDSIKTANTFNKYKKLTKVWITDQGRTLYGTI